MAKHERAGDDDRRSRAEDQLAARGPAVPGSSENPARLVHELHVHQIELEMQNEELRRARDQTEAALQLYTELFDFAPVGYVVLDKLGKITRANLELARMAGVARSVLAGSSFAALLDPADRERFGDFLWKWRQGDLAIQGAPLEARFQPRTGEPSTVRLTASAYSHKEPTVLLAVHDVTARRRAEIAREEIARRDEFLAALSHELRNPLFPICTSLAVVARADLPPNVRKPIATIGRQVDHLVHIVDDLLEVTRLTRGKIALQRQRMELVELARQAVEDHRAEFEAKSLGLQSKLDSAPLWIDADATRIVQVIENLLVNASKFTAPGGRVEVRLQREGSLAVLTVRDDGAGIAADVLDRLFVPFTQGPQGLDRTRGGLGLGLAMVKGLVEAHGGNVSAASEGLGRGSEFTVRLPLVEAPVAHEEPVASPPHGPSRRVLVIEDNADAAEALCDLLAEDGHDVRVAHCGIEGLALARGFCPDVVFCDIGLPGMDGYAVARAFRAEAALARTCLVALSGYARPEDRRRAAEAGFDGHLAKPPSDEDIAAVLDGRYSSASNGTAAVHATGRG